MITSIHGTLAAASPLLAVVEINGLGYEVNIPVTTAERLPASLSRSGIASHATSPSEVGTGAERCGITMGPAGGASSTTRTCSV